MLMVGACLAAGAGALAAPPFEDTLAQRRAANRRLPIVASHDWDDPMKTIGGAEPTEINETDKGLEVKARLHIDSNPIAAQVFKLMQEGLWTDWSFGYTVPDGGEKMKERGARQAFRQ